ncbi:MAG: hypothetical protein JNJ49_05415 [Bdellovibrionaceae bacterium]|nr:hypothetical protein [Pseudobdellovibrionaceae bacterium]
MRLDLAVIRFILTSVFAIAICIGLVWPPAVAMAYTTESCHTVAALEHASAEHATHVEGTTGSCQPCEQSSKVPHKEKNHPCCSHSLSLAWVAPSLQGEAFEMTARVSAMRDGTYPKAPFLDGPFQPPRRSR